VCKSGGREMDAWGWGTGEGLELVGGWKGFQSRLGRMGIGNKARGEI